jgi:hypothetical protein
MPNSKKPAARPKTKAEPVRVAFQGQIKSFKSALDSVGDKVGTLIIGFRPEGPVIAELDALQKPDAEVFVVIVEKAE